MKSIQYKTLGAILERGPSGKRIKKPILVTEELPYSEENLEQAQARALPDTLQIISREDHEQLHGAKPADALQRICLIDRATGNPFEVYVENGKLMMEVL